MFEIRSRKDALNLGVKLIEILFRHKKDIGLKRKTYIGLVER